MSIDKESSIGTLNTSMSLLLEQPDVLSETDKIKVCIVTPDFSGPILNGGIGTLYSGLARVLVDNGMDVTVLYTLGEKSETKNFSYWQGYYERENITLIAMPEPKVGNPNAPRPLLRAYSVYEWLKDKQFDFIHFPDWMGLAFYCVQAKKMGMYFENSCLVVGCHGPTMWNWQGNRQIPTDAVVFTFSYMERICAENADYVISSSRHLIDWMAKEGWEYPVDRTFHQRNIYHNVCNIGCRKTTRSKIKEIAFCGRLEFRKGIHIFCDSLKRLDNILDEDVKITIIGKPVVRKDFNSLQFIKSKVAGLKHKVTLLTELDVQELISYLSTGNKLAVIASTSDNSPMIINDFLNNNIPFIASDAGGIPELIDERDSAIISFKPTAKGLSDRILNIINDDIYMPHAAESSAQINSDWVLWHEVVKRKKPYLIKNNDCLCAPVGDVITVCMVHHDRPKELEVALNALENQTFKDFTVVVVDDGSKNKETLQYLGELEERFKGKRWKLVRQDNLYVGAARNNAARHAKTKYLVFMDDDNVAKPNELELMYKAIEYSKSDILTSFADVFEGAWQGNESKPHRRMLFAGGLVANGLWVNMLSDANCIMKKEVFDGIGGFHEKFGTGLEDFHFFVKAALAEYKIRVIPEALFWYKISPTRIRKKHYSMDDANMMILDAYIEKTPMHLRELLFSAYSRSVSNKSVFAEKKEGKAIPQDIVHVPSWTKRFYHFQKRVFGAIIFVQRKLIEIQINTFESLIQFQVSLFLSLKKLVVRFF